MFSLPLHGIEKEKPFDKWEFLKHRARLAAVCVKDEGDSVLFDSLGNKVRFNKSTETENAAQWLQRLGVNLPGWELPWPGAL